MELQIVKKAFNVKDPSVKWEFDAPDENWQIVFAKTAGEVDIYKTQSNH